MLPIFILIGPPAVGKSTTSKALASNFGKSIHIPVDYIRDMVVSGLALPGIEWSAELIQQIRLARESVIFTALNYQKAGFAVVIDDFIDPNQLIEYQVLQDKPGVYKFVLFPQQEAAYARNLQRAGDTPAREYIDAGIRSVYQQLKGMINPLRDDGWIVLDTTAMSIDETVLEILKYKSD